MTVKTSVHCKVLTERYYTKSVQSSFNFKWTRTKTNKKVIGKLRTYSRIFKPNKSVVIVHEELTLSINYLVYKENPLHFKRIFELWARYWEHLAESHGPFHVCLFNASEEKSEVIRADISAIGVHNKSTTMTNPILNLEDNFC